MEKVEPTKVVLGALGVLTLWMVFITLGYFVAIALQLPRTLGFPLTVRSIGLLVCLSSFLSFAWLVQYRKPKDILISTLVTFSKMAKRIRLDEQSIRTEPLVIKGPYRFVRHPLYLGVVLLTFGLWLGFDYTPLFFTTVLFLVWFNFVVAPFEEKELRAIFGQSYEEYARQVPTIIPISLSRDRGGSAQSHTA